MSSTLLFGVCPGPDIAAAESYLAQEKPFIDGIELRLDQFKQIDLSQLGNFVKSCGLPVVFTVREQQFALLDSLCALQPAYVDLTHDAPADVRKKLFEAYPKIQFICSYHDFSETPADLDALLAKMKTPHAHIYKIAVTAKTANDALRMLVFTQSCKEKLIGICMGEEGKITRILAPVVGGYLTYAVTITAKELQEVYHFRKLNKETKIFGVIGDPIDKSLGHLIHNAIFDDAKINAVYLRMRVKQDELPDFFKLIFQLPFRGMSVTMPLKHAVIPFLKQISIETRLIGACNTFVIENGQATGYNTDGIGAMNALEKRGVIFGKHLVFVGAGGAAKALIFEAGKRGAYCTIVNRTPEKAIEMAEIVKGEGGGFELMDAACQKGYDAIINCTPESDFISDKWILPGKIAMHILYVPKDTPFLMRAAQKQCPIVYGYEMFVAQALEQEIIWFPEAIDPERAFKIIEEKVKSAL